MKKFMILTMKSIIWGGAILGLNSARLVFWQEEVLELKKLVEEAQEHTAAAKIQSIHRGRISRGVSSDVHAVNGGQKKLAHHWSHKEMEGSQEAAVFGMIDKAIKQRRSLFGHAAVNARRTFEIIDRNRYERTIFLKNCSSSLLNNFNHHHFECK